MALVYSAGNFVCTPLKAASLNGHFDILYCLNCGVSVDSTNSDGPTALRAATSNVHHEVTQQLLSNGCICILQGNVK